MPGTKLGPAAAAELTDGAVRKIDKDKHKSTLQHGATRKLDMPGLTIVFKLKEGAILKHAESRRQGEVQSREGWRRDRRQRARSGETRRGRLLARTANNSEGNMKSWMF